MLAFVFYPSRAPAGHHALARRAAAGGFSGSCSYATRPYGLGFSFVGSDIDFYLRINFRICPNVSKEKALFKIRSLSLL